MKSIYQRVIDSRQKRQKEAEDSLASFGEQDVMDIVSYAGMEEHDSYLVIDGMYVRTLSLSGYPYTAELGWLDSLTNFHHNADISYHIEQVDSNVALRKLTRKITELETTKRQRIRSGAIIGPDIEDPLQSAIELRDSIQRGQEKLFQVSIYISLFAKDVDSLQDVTQLLESSLQARLFLTKIARYRQLEGLQSVLPRAENKLNNPRNLNSSTAALAFPFISSELVQDGGILYGVNKSGNSLVILDRFQNWQ